MIKSINKISILFIILLIILTSINPLTLYCEGETKNSGTEDIVDVQNEDIYEDAMPDDFDEGSSEEEQSEYIEQSEENEAANVPYSRAKVIKIIEEEQNVDSSEEIGISMPTQIVEVLIIKGLHQGETALAEYALNYNFNDKYRLNKLHEGDEVLLYIEENEDGTLASAYVTEFARDKYLLYLVIAFIIILILIGKGRGIKAVISLILTAIAIVKILIPAILAGKNPIILSVAVCAVIIGVTMLIISGPNKKTLSAVIGTIGGVILAGVIAIIVGSLARLTGLGSDESQMLMYIPQNIQFDFKGLLFAGILIGTMGANMDVGMSIASAMHEIKANNPQINPKDLMNAGMNVGRDIMATMSNTLILAYAGGSLHLMLLVAAYSTPFSHVINWDFIASEVLRSIAGSIGLVITIPITAFVTSKIEQS